MRTASPLSLETLTPDALRSTDSTEHDITLVFLRHRGCLFTREWMQELRSVVDESSSRLVLIHQGSDAEFDHTLRPLWPAAEAVSDPSASLYAAWSVERGGFNAMFGVRSWLAGIPAFLRGNRIGWKGKADGWTLPTIIRVRDQHVVWTHRGTHAGDHPDLCELR